MLSKQSIDEAKALYGCPLLYAQAENDDAVLEAFKCYGVSHIPDCKRFDTGECWEIFDSLGLKTE